MRWTVRARAPRTHAGQWCQLVGGLLCFAVAVSLMIRSGLGLGPWDAFHLGVHYLVGISVGTASIAVGVLIVFGSWFLGVRPGAGTLANMVLIGILIDAVLPWVAPASGPAWGMGYYAAAIALAGLGTGMYIGAGLGKGPRDGLMLALSDRSGWPVRRVRTLIEVSALGCGWAMGGQIGPGTLLFTLLIGPAAQWGLQLFGVVEAATPAPVPAPGRARRPWRWAT